MMRRLAILAFAAAAAWGTCAAQPAKSYRFNAVHFPTTDYGYIVGDEGLVLVTTDAGATWKESVTGRTYDYRSVFFLTEGIGMVGGDNAIFLMTIDAGANWTPNIVSEMSTNYQINRIWFSGPTEGWVLGIDTSGTNTLSRLCHTVDGAHSWSTELSPTTGYFTAMAFQDFFANGVVVGDTALRMYYGGSGQLWHAADQVIFPPLPRYSRRIVYDAFYTPPTSDLATTAYACGYGDAAKGEPTIYLRTDDGGFTWQYLAQDAGDRTYGNAFRMYFLDPTHGIAVGSAANGSFVSRTEDGEHFVPVLFVDSARTRLRDITGNGSDLWVIGSDCYLAHSTDFGTTWKRTFLCGPVGVEHPAGPADFSLDQNFPNPFPSGSSTIIHFSLAGDGSGRPQPILLEVRDALGRRLRILAEAEFAPGDYSIAFPSGDLPTGMYFYRLTAAGTSQTRKMMIVRGKE